MSLAYLDQQLDAIREKAEELRRNVSASRSAINADKTLSQIGKDALLEDITDRAQTTSTELRNQEDKLTNDKRASLERTISGPVGSDSASIISYRDAQDRADKLETQGEAERLMNRALASGDKSLASAVAQAALANGWSKVYEPYAAQNPTIATAVEDLGKLNHYFNDSGMSLMRTMAYHVV